MISIPVAVANNLFKWQLDLFWYNHKLVYGSEAKNKAFAVVINHDNFYEEVTDDIDWNISVPYQMCNSFYKELKIDYELGILKPINIQIGLKQIIDRFDDEEVIELLDCDLFHLKPYPEYQINDNELITFDLYENWHLKCLSDNKHIIEPYFLNNGRYYNGGFVPIIGKVKTFKLILDDWIFIHRDIVNRDFESIIKWWAGMYSLSAACERNKVQMISKDTCYIPNVNQLSENHHICHYSVDPRFDKKKFPNIDLNSFDDNYFYNQVKSWFLTYK